MPSPLGAWRPNPSWRGKGLGPWSMVHGPWTFRAMTLIELMLAIALFSFLMGSIGALVRWGLQIDAQWGNGLQPYVRLERLFSQLEDDLVSAEPLFAVPFRGTSTRVEFARVEVIDGDAGRVPQWIRVVYRLDGAALVREAFRWSDAVDTAQPIEHRTLATLSGGTFAFAVLEGQGAVLRWVAAWDGTHDGIPRFVQLTGTMAADGTATPVAFERVIRNPVGALPVQQTP